jgi:hypothetical protein
MVDYRLDDLGSTLPLPHFPCPCVHLSSSLSRISTTVPQIVFISALRSHRSAQQCHRLCSSQLFALTDQHNSATYCVHLSSSLSRISTTVPQIVFSITHALLVAVAAPTRELSITHALLVAVAVPTRELSTCLFCLFVAYLTTLSVAQTVVYSVEWEAD